MTAPPEVHTVDFLFALVEAPVKDMIRLAFTVCPDGAWTMQVGRHASLGPGVDSTLHVLEGDATTTAPDLLRALAGHILAPHEMSLPSMEQSS